MDDTPEPETLGDLPRDHRVQIRKGGRVLWEAKCRCGWFHARVIWRTLLGDAADHAAKPS